MRIPWPRPGKICCDLWDGRVRVNLCLQRVAATEQSESGIAGKLSSLRRASGGASIAFHPSGLYVVVGFTDKLRLMSSLMDDMRVIKEISEGVRECRFSNGDNLFAAVNQTAMQIFDTYTCATRMQLRAHQQAVRSIIWTDKDRKIVTVGKDGNVYLWNVRTCDICARVCNLVPRSPRRL